MDLICVDEKYPPDCIAFWKEHGVSWPKVDSIDSPREVIKHATGEIGIRLENLVNPLVPIDHPFIGRMVMEPSFSIKRFRTLSGDEVTREMMREFDKVKTKV